MRIVMFRWLLPAVLATCSWPQEVAVSAPVEHNFPAVGIEPGQTIRITALNIVRSATPAGVRTVPCSLTVRIHDESGKALTEEKIDDLAPGTAKWVDYSPKIAILVYPPPRFLVAAVVQVSAAALGLVTDMPEIAWISPCRVIPTLEVFDASTNKTVFAMPGPALNSPRPMVYRGLATPDREAGRRQ